MYFCVQKWSISQNKAKNPWMSHERSNFSFRRALHTFHVIFCFVNVKRNQKQDSECSEKVVLETGFWKNCKSMTRFPKKSQFCVWVCDKKSMNEPRKINICETLRPVFSRPAQKLPNAASSTSNATKNKTLTLEDNKAPPNPDSDCSETLKRWCRRLILKR